MKSSVTNERFAAVCCHMLDVRSIPDVPQFDRAESDEFKSESPIALGEHQ